MRVLVTGGTGFIGRFIVEQLVQQGHEVRALVRDRERAAPTLGPGVELSSGSALDVAAVRTALSGCDALVQSAGVYSYARGDAQRVLAETPALARSVLTAALEARTPRVVDVASTVVYTTNVDVISATTRLAAPGDQLWGDVYARAKVAAESFGQTMEARGLPRVTLHPARVVGPRDSGPGTSGASVIALLRGGVTTDARGGWIDVRDVADAAVAALEAPFGTHAVLSSSSMRYRELGPLLDRLTGRPRRRMFAPAAMLRAVARVNDAFRGRLMDLPAAGGLESILTTPPIDGSTGEALLGVPYRPLEASLTDAIRWWAANGIIEQDLAGRLAT